MKAITVRQPWAQAIATGAKTVENRTRLYAYRGPFAIHAGTGWSDRGAADDRIAQWHGQRQGFSIPCHPMPLEELFPTGVIVAVADLVDVHPDGGCCRPWGESSYVEAGGRDRRQITHMVLEGVMQLTEPVPARGWLGLWDVPAELAVAIARGVAA